MNIKDFEYFITGIVTDIINIHVPKYFLGHLNYKWSKYPGGYNIVQNPETKTQDVHLTIGDVTTIIPFKFDGYPRELITKEDVEKNLLTPGVNALIVNLTEKYFPFFSDSNPPLLEHPIGKPSPSGFIENKTPILK